MADQITEEMEPFYVGNFKVGQGKGYTNLLLVSTHENMKIWGLFCSLLYIQNLDSAGI